MRRAWFALLPLLVALVALLAWHRGGGPFAGREPVTIGQPVAPGIDAGEIALRTRAPEPPEAPPDTHAFEVAPAAASANVDAAQFDETRPLADRIAALDARARRGDAAAGCQLGIELVRCDRERRMQGFHENLDAQAQGAARQAGDARALDARADHMLQRQQRNRRVLASCAGVDPAQWAAPARYLRLAAERGHPAAMRLMLDDELYFADQLYRDPGLIPMLRADGPRWFRTLLERGDPALLDRVRNAGDRDFLPEILPPPWNSPEVANEILRQMHGENPLYPQPAQPLTAEQREQARQAREAWFEPNREWQQAERGQRENALSLGDAADFGCRELAR